MEKYDLEYLKKNINLKTVHKAMDVVKDTDNDAVFKIGDIPIELFESTDDGYAIYLNPKGISTSPVTRVTKDDTADEICECIYNTNNITIGEVRDTPRSLLFEFFQRVNSKYESNVKVPLFGGHVKFLDRKGGVLVYFDDLVIHSLNVHLSDENKETTLYNRFLRNINVWELLTTVIEMDKE